MGMETMVFFTVDGTEICGRVEPSSAGDAGATMRLHANVDHMHLIDPASGAVSSVTISYAFAAAGAHSFGPAR
jgi:multiple sugar transport system ATP-binding protein